MVGATPVFVDVDLNTYNLDPNLIVAKITERTKAIYASTFVRASHCNMTAIMAIARDFNLKVIEDCAQATGSMWCGQKDWYNWGLVDVLASFPTKNLGCFGDGGAIATNDPVIAERVEYLRRHGGKVKYEHEELGLNSRLDTMQATILLVKLPLLEQWNAARAAIADYYLNHLADFKGIVLPKVMQGGISVWNQFTVRILSGQRDRVQSFMKSRGVGTMVYYPIPLHLQKVHARLGYSLGELPTSERLSDEVLSLPMFPELTLSAQEVVAESLREALADIYLYSNLR